MSSFVPVKPASKAAPASRPSLTPSGDRDDVSASRIQGSEISLTVKSHANEGLMETFARLGTGLREHEASLVHVVVFGSVRAATAGREAMRRVFGRVDWPITWIEGAACDGRALAGIQACAVTGVEVQRVILDGQVLGSIFEDGLTRHCVLGGIGPDRTASAPATQTAEAMEKIDKALAECGFSFSDIVRTWFYLADILSWYDEFNRVRTQKYSGVRFCSGSLPASTGIAARNPGAAALVAAVRAIQPLDAATRAEGVASPLQCAAMAYGSAFSRAMEIRSAAGTRLFVSGTASIAPGGQTVWDGEPARQIERTLDVVQSILRSRGLELPDITTAVAYFKYRGQVDLFSRACAARGWHSPPVVAVQADICRDDLLFELEADAWRATESGASNAADFMI